MTPERLKQIGNVIARQKIMQPDCYSINQQWRDELFEYVIQLAAKLARSRNALEVAIAERQHYFDQKNELIELLAKEQQKVLELTRQQGEPNVQDQSTEVSDRPDAAESSRNAQ